MRILKTLVSIMFAVSLAACGGSGAETATAPTESATTGETAATEVITQAHPGEAIYQKACFSCHDRGLSGAPALGDKEAWAPRIAKGEALLVQSTIEGIAPAMPPKGMCFDCSDEDFAAVVDYMVSKSQ